MKEGVLSWNRDILLNSLRLAAWHTSSSIVVLGGSMVQCWSPWLSTLRAGMELATPRPAPLRVPSQLYDDTPAAAEMVMPLKGRRVGVYRQLFEDAAPDVVRACQHAVDLLKEHGCEVGPPLTVHLTPQGSSPACVEHLLGDGNLGALKFGLWPSTAPLYAAT